MNETRLQLTCSEPARDAPLRRALRPGDGEGIEMEGNLKRRERMNCRLDGYTGTPQAKLRGLKLRALDLKHRSVRRHTVSQRASEELNIIL